MQTGTLLHIAALLAAALSALAAIFAWKAARAATAQRRSAEQLEREQAVDLQWMRFQDYYRDCIALFARDPDMSVERYRRLGTEEQRRIHLATAALLQALDLAYRAGDEFRARNIRRYLSHYEGPLSTPGAIHTGVLMHERTIAEWNEVRLRHGQPKKRVATPALELQPGG